MNSDNRASVGEWSTGLSPVLPDDGTLTTVVWCLVLAQRCVRLAAYLADSCLLGEEASA